MRTCQGGLTPNASWGLQTRRLGPLPLINHIVSRLHLDERLERFVPTQDRRVRLAYAKGLGVLLRQGGLARLVDSYPPNTLTASGNFTFADYAALNTGLLTFYGRAGKRKRDYRLAIQVAEAARAE